MQSISRLHCLQVGGCFESLPRREQAFIHLSTFINFETTSEVLIDLQVDPESDQEAEINASSTSALPTALRCLVVVGHRLPAGRCLCLGPGMRSGVASKTPK